MLHKALLDTEGRTVLFSIDSCYTAINGKVPEEYKHLKRYGTLPFELLSFHLLEDPHPQALESWYRVARWAGEESWGELNHYFNHLNLSQLLATVQSVPLCAILHRVQSKAYVGT